MNGKLHPNLIGQVDMTRNIRNTLEVDNYAPHR